MADRYCSCFETELTFDNEACFEMGFEDQSEWTTSMEQVVPLLVNDYNDLINKPSINDVELQGNQTSEDLQIVLRATTEYWSGQTTLISKPGALYVYTDYQTVDNGDGTFTMYPAIKVGDGTSYVVDLPFTSSDNPVVAAHIIDGTVHVTAAEKEFWNQKWSGYVDDNNPENLFFTTNAIVLGGNLHA